MIKLIIFDLWRTLAQRGPKGYRSTLEIKKTFNLKIPHKKVIRIFEEVTQTKIWETEYDAYKELLIALKVEPSEENILKVIKIRSVAEMPMVLYDFTIPLLKQLREQGIKTGLLTNSSKFIRDVFEKNTELLDHIDYPLFSYELETIKPNPRLFLEMQRRSKISNPKEIIMIGDDYEDDVLGALELGFNAIEFNGNYKDLKKELLKFDVVVE